MIVSNTLARLIISRSDPTVTLTASKSLEEFVLSYLRVSARSVEGLKMALRLPGGVVSDSLCADRTLIVKRGVTLVRSTENARCRVRQITITACLYHNAAHFCCLVGSNCLA